MAEHKAASVEISFFDVNGLPCEPPLDLATTYTIVIDITNLTETVGGQPWEALFEIGYEASLDGVELVLHTVPPPTLFQPGQLQRCIAKVYIHQEYAGMKGVVRARVFDAFGGQIASAQKRIEVGFELSPETKYDVSGQVLFKNPDIALNPDIETTEGEAVMDIMGAVTPVTPPAPPKPKPDYTQAKPPPGLDTTTEPEPPVEWEGETIR